MKEEPAIAREIAKALIAMFDAAAASAVRQNQNPLSYTIDGAVQASGIGRTSLYEMLKSGRLRARKSGRRTIIMRDDLRSAIESLPETKDVGGDE